LIRPGSLKVLHLLGLPKHDNTKTPATTATKSRNLLTITQVTTCLTQTRQHKPATAAMKLRNGCPPKSRGTLGSHDSGHSRNEIAEFSSYTAPKKCQLKKNGNGRNEIAEWLPKSCGYHSTLRSHDSSHSRNEIAEFSHGGGPKFPYEKNGFNTSFSKRELRTLLLCTS